MSPRCLAVAALLSVSLVAACSGEPATTPRKGDGKHAAEPAASPPLRAEPAGTTTKVAPGPQGIVYDARTRSLAVAVRDPYRLVVLDARSLRQRFSVQLPGKVRHLQVTTRGGTALVPSETANTLFEVDLRTGKARATKVQRHPHDASGAGDGDVLVANEFSGSLSKVRDGKVVATQSDLRQPGGVHVVGSTVVAVDVGDYTVTTYDLDSLRRVSRAPAGKGPTHGVPVGGGKFAVTDTRGNQVLLYTLRPLRQVGRLALPGSPYGVVGDPAARRVWVTLTGRNELVGLDVSGSTPRVVARYPTVRQPDTVTLDPATGTLWVTGTADGVLERIPRG